MRIRSTPRPTGPIQQWLFFCVNGGVLIFALYTFALANARGTLLAVITLCAMAIVSAYAVIRSARSRLHLSSNEIIVFYCLQVCLGVGSVVLAKLGGAQ